MATSSNQTTTGRTFDHQILVLQGGGALGHAAWYQLTPERMLLPHEHA